MVHPIYLYTEGIKAHKMEIMTWQTSFDTGIDEIDNQHRELLEYLNQLGAAIQKGNKDEVTKVISGLADYTLSHFAFEEALMAEANYQFTGPHKHVHQTLIKKVVDFSDKLKAGEDIENDLYNFLKRWLINHIQRDDAAYVKSVNNHFNAPNKASEPVEEVVVRSSWFSKMKTKVFG